MPIAIKMPALSPTMEQGKLARWLVKVGDTVSSGDIMAEIETDKATMEFEAVDEGTIVSIDIAEGTDDVKVGTVIASSPARAKTPPPSQPPPRLPLPKSPLLLRLPPLRPRLPRLPPHPLPRLPVTAWLPRRWPAALPPRRASIWLASPVRAPMAASSRPTSRAPSPAPPRLPLPPLRRLPLLLRRAAPAAPSALPDFGIPHEDQPLSTCARPSRAA
jgi:pyruvate dehydrogenase E2 component (dihydrolipoamide acetyltransferase)